MPERVIWKCRSKSCTQRGGAVYAGRIVVVVVSESTIGVRRVVQEGANVAVGLATDISFSAVNNVVDKCSVQVLSVVMQMR